MRLALISQLCHDVMRGIKAYAKNDFIANVGCSVFFAVSNSIHVSCTMDMNIV